MLSLAEGCDHSGLRENKPPASCLCRAAPSAGAEAVKKEHKPLSRVAGLGDFSFVGGTVKTHGPRRVSFSLSRVR